MALIVHILASLVGIAIIGCMAHATVTGSGGYATANAPLMLVLAAGLAVGSLAAPIASRENRRWIVAGLVVALAAGETWSLLTTAERTVVQREAQQAPLRSAASKRARAEQRLKEARAAAGAIDATAMQKSSERGCLGNCRQLLQATQDKAASEAQDARGEVDALPAAQSPTPLADRLGIEPWKLDLISAGLASLAANGLAAFLLAFAAHGVLAAPPVLEVVPPVARDATAEADRFARQTFRPNPAEVRVAEIRQAYRLWCRRHGLDPLSDYDIGQALSVLFSSVGLYRLGEGADAVIVGIGWKYPEIEGPGR